MPDTPRHKEPRTLGEPLRSWREAELAIGKARASFCFFQHRILGRSLLAIAKEQGMSYERIRHLSERAKSVYGVLEADYDKVVHTDKR